jgi:hypothetical protein
MERAILPELLDVLPPQDSAALRSRRDLRRINAWMGHPGIMARALKNASGRQTVRRIAELGAGDGHFLLGVAGRLRGLWPDAGATLVDRLDVLDPKARGEFERLGWRVQVETAEAAEWLQQVPPDRTQAIISNLFFHHFETEQLAELLRLAAEAAGVVIALEPRRSWLARLGGRLLWVIGCSPLTRHDANISIRAGFTGHELSALWPDKENWELIERPAGLFSHLFVARRKP